MNSSMMKAMIVKNKDNQEKLAQALGLPTSALNARINGRTEFRLHEVNEIRKRYGLTQAETMQIFFDDLVS